MPPPRCLARWRAVSASDSSDSARRVRDPVRAMPMLAETTISCPPTANGVASPAVIRSARRTASRSWARSGQSTANSSLPKRDTVSLGRRMLRSRPATATSSRSTASSPKRSATSLKRSRSTTSTAARAGSRPRRARVISSRSRNRLRLGSPVRASWVARQASWSSGRRPSRRSTSWRTTKRGRPWPSRCSGSPRWVVASQVLQSTEIASPSTRRQRCWSWKPVASPVSRRWSCSMSVSRSSGWTTAW